ncbi:hypothetical protein R9X44_00675 [Actinocorallia sp. A-T 12471]|nr:hypothetical protein [Actinocorallia sp. A-T 12471]MDX6738263.1 hypothetical protein [Actinocorallia sp. A-T 12471]
MTTSALPSSRPCRARAQWTGVAASWLLWTSRIGGAPEPERALPASGSEGTGQSTQASHWDSTCLPNSGATATASAPARAAASAVRSSGRRCGHRTAWYPAGTVPAPSSASACSAVRARRPEPSPRSALASALATFGQDASR